MNTERLNAISKSLLKDFKSLQLLPKLQKTVTALQNVVNASNASTQSELATHLKNLYSALEESEFNSYSPSWRQVIAELQDNIFLGNDLADNIKTILSGNTITLSIALEEISKTSASLTHFHKAITDISTGFDILNIGAEDLDPGDSEIGILIPRIFVDNKLEQFMAELKEINFIISTFSEYTTGKKHKLELKTISSTDYLIYLSLVPPTAACLAKTVSWIVETYKNILEIRKLKMELKNKGVPDKSMSGLNDYTNKVMQEQLDKLEIEIENEYCVIKDDKGGRRNEVRNGIRISLNKLANRIDKGFNFEIRMALPEPENGEKDKPSLKAEETNKKYHDEISKASQILEFRKLEGDSLLSLPEKLKEEK